MYEYRCLAVTPEPTFHPPLLPPPSHHFPHFWDGDPSWSMFRVLLTWCLCAAFAPCFTNVKTIRSPVPLSGTWWVLVVPGRASTGPQLGQENIPRRNTWPYVLSPIPGLMAMQLCLLMSISLSTLCLPQDFLLFSTHSFFRYRQKQCPLTCPDQE